MDFIRVEFGVIGLEMSVLLLLLKCWQVITKLHISYL